MGKICTNDKTVARQRWIENGLLTLMQEQRFEEITVTELCRHLDLSRRSFYRYFRDLEDVLNTLLDHAFQDMAMGDTLLTIEELEENYRFWHRQKPLLTALIRSGLHGKLTEYIMKYAGHESLRSYLPEEDLALDMGQELSLFAIGGTVSLMISWYADGFRKTPEQMAQITYRMLHKPLFSQA